eukprot:3268264-Rhodomonas_salina.2
MGAWLAFLEARASKQAATVPKRATAFPIVSLRSNWVVKCGLADQEVALPAFDSTVACATLTHTARICSEVGRRHRGQPGTGSSLSRSNSARGTTCPVLTWRARYNVSSTDVPGSGTRATCLRLWQGCSAIPAWYSCAPLLASIGLRAR